MKKIITLFLTSLLFLTSCSSQDNESSNTSSIQDTAKQRQTVQADAEQPKYLVAALSTFPPFVFRNEQGQFIGFDVDVLKAIGEREGFSVTYLVNPWEGIFDTLSSGERDIISTALVITPERKELADFSDPYFQSGRMALVTDPELKTFEQLKGKRFVTQAGTSNEPILREYFGQDINLTGVNTQYQEIKELLSGRADVAFDDSGVMAYYLRQQDGKIHGIMHPTYPGDDFGFAVKKGNKELLDKINHGLAAIHADGTYKDIYKKWFGEEPPAKTENVQ